MIQLKFQNLEKIFVIVLKFFRFIENDNNKKFMKIYRSFSFFLGINITKLKNKKRYYFYKSPNDSYTAVVILLARLSLARKFFWVS